METLRTKREFLLLQLLFLFLFHQAPGMAAALEPVRVRVESFQAPFEDGAPNTFMGTGRQIESSLLDATTPALMFGVISYVDVSVVCEHIVNTGSLSFIANVTTTLRSSTTQSVISSQITAAEGCMEASDASRTQAVMVDDSGRQSVLVCPSDADSTGCAIYLTGDDVTNLYNQGVRRRLLAQRKLLGHSCADEAKKGAISGTITGVLAVAACAAFTGPMVPFCAAGMLGASAGLGAAASCASSCFPGDATVATANGGVKRMTALALGDKVAVRKHDGRLAYEDVYAFGHKDPFPTTNFLRLTLKPINSNFSDPEVESKNLELTALHFVPTSSGVAGNLVYKRAQDIINGDQMWTQGVAMSDDGTVSESSLYIVTSITQIEKQGLYNPFTLGGTIIVNGVVASTHSDWFLDDFFQALDLVHWLPAVNQMVLLPVQMLYYGLGKDLYITLYQRLDALVDLSKFASQHGGNIVTIVSAASGLVATLMLSRVTMGCQSRRTKFAVN